MTDELQPVSQYELTVVGVLRLNAWRWLLADSVHQECDWLKRRVVRHHLERLLAAGVIEQGSPWGPYRHLVGYRWSSTAPAAYVAHLERAARAAGAELPSLGQAPTHCDEGHLFTTEGVATVWERPDGERFCIPCGEIILTDPTLVRYGRLRRVDTRPPPTRERGRGGAPDPTRPRGGTSEAAPEQGKRIPHLNREPSRGS